MSIVRTVLGDVDPAELGHTQPHEHLLADLSRPLPARSTARERAADNAPITLENHYRTRRHHPSEDLRLDSVDVAVAELRPYAEAGGRTIVDATSIGLGRDPMGLATVSRRSGVHVVMGCGFYYRDYHPDDVAARDRDDLAAEIVSDLRTGVGGTSVRAGIIGEIGLSHPLHPQEEKVLRAACTAQRETGAALMIHPGRDPRSPGRALDIVAAEDVDPARVIMSHVERTVFSAPEMRAIASSGCYVEFDLFGQESSYYSLGPVDMPNDATRVDHILDLIDGGHASQILISQDICHKTNLVRYGGEGYAHILEHVLPLMRRKDVSDAHIAQITVANPARALAFAG
ncbi:aryldialkylphosphatase [Nonomuraea sp. MG754425]|uniref:phosphotriesterase family protein n=1 Tax=Nonomuraea sp. MG754425 TaxID=2570319 RepID=UPI001EFF6F98|nr:TatD family hydrolase [Nonomuraea sp. MG754425]MCF6476319.1 aryldialkylphosphatase [Nonomuraea sp. MG754425]